MCVLIPKGNEKDTREITSWRPLGLLNVLGKIYESVIVNRINYDLKRKGHISKRQFGFMEGLSSVDALKAIVGEAKKNKSQGKQVAIMSMDIQGAFDRAKWDVMKEQMKKYQVNIKLMKVMESYLSDREVWYPVGRKYEKKETNQGCVQGSIAGPLMWNIIINELLGMPTEEAVEIFAYADDVTIVASGYFAKNVVQKLSRTAKKIQAWGQKSGFEFNPKKTMYLPLTAKLRKEHVPVTMGTKCIPRHKSIQILGLTMDDHLSFKQHVDKVINEAEKAYAKIGTICSKTWGASTKVITKIYEAGIRPIVTYACEVWAGVIGKTMVNKLHSFQRKYLLLAAKAYKTTSREALETITVVPPIDLYSSPHQFCPS